MSKNKLSKFAEMATYTHVVEAPFQTPDTPPHPLRGRWHSAWARATHISLHWRRWER